jgi:hypothetical protein
LGYKSFLIQSLTFPFLNLVFGLSGRTETGQQGEKTFWFFTAQKDIDTLI